MKISRSSALRLWAQRYGDAKFAEDFHGNLMYRDAYGDDERFVVVHGTRIGCGWNIHHILPERISELRRQLYLKPEYL